MKKIGIKKPIQEVFGIAEAIEFTRLMKAMGKFEKKVKKQRKR